MGAARQERRSRRELAQFEYEKNLEMWNRQNEYNRPDAQMQRLKDAGLNPNLVYGSQSVTGNTVGQAPQYNAPTLRYKGVEPSDLQGIISQYQDVELKIAQQNNIQAQTEITQQRTLNEAIQNDILSTAAQKAGVDLEKSEKLLPHSLDIQKSKAQQERQKIKINNKDLSIKELVKQEKQADVLFKKHRNELAKHGIYQSDNAGFRLMIKAANAAGINPQKIIRELVKKKPLPAGTQMRN